VYRRIDKEAALHPLFQKVTKNVAKTPTVVKRAAKSGKKLAKKARHASKSM
jgi:hypothetical protein